MSPPPDESLKALVLAGGKGTRLRPLTYAMAKQLVPVANKPILHYALDSLYHGGIRRFGIIISPETGPMIRASVDRWRPQDAAVEFILQETPAGLAHAVKVAQPYLGADDFILYLGDNLINGDLRTLIDAFRREPCDASLLLKPVANPSAFGVAELDARQNVVRLVEKPEQPPSDLALVGVYLFRNTIFEAIEAIRPSQRGELEITDAIQRLIDCGRTVRCRIHEGWWLDTGKKDDMLEANRTILGELRGNACWGDISADSEVIGPVEIGRESRICRSRITGPVKIGAGCQIEDAVIGPDTSIGDGCEIVASDIRNSVLLEGCRIRNLSSRIEESLIGQGCRIESLKAREDTQSPVDAPTHRFLLADHSEILVV